MKKILIVIIIILPVYVYAEIVLNIDWSPKHSSLDRIYQLDHYEKPVVVTSFKTVGGNDVIYKVSNNVITFITPTESESKGGKYIIKGKITDNNTPFTVNMMLETLNQVADHKMAVGDNFYTVPFGSGSSYKYYEYYNGSPDPVDLIIDMNPLLVVTPDNPIKLVAVKKWDTIKLSYNSDDITFRTEENIIYIDNFYKPWVRIELDLLFNKIPGKKQLSYHAKGTYRSVFYNGNCTFTGVVEKPDSKNSLDMNNSYVSIETKAGFFPVTQYMKVDKDGKFSFQNVPDWSKENIKSRVTVFDMDGNIGKIKEQKLVCTPLEEFFKK